MTPEGRVVAAVEQYFSQPKFQKFSTKKEDRIRFGSRLGFADVVLVGSKGNRSAIVECKRPGVEGGGPDQLKSYLCATDTPFGLFANSTEPNNWKFYENLGQNQFGYLTRSEFEKRVVKGEKEFINRVSNFFRRFPQFKSSESNKIETYQEPVEIEMDREPDTSNPAGTLRKPRIIIKDRPLQNEYREKTIEPSLNGNPYYSEQNGFYWAANHQGIAECLPQHIKRIIHNEEVEIVATREELDEEANLLRQDIAELNEQKNKCKGEIVQRTQEIAQKKEELAKLEVQLQAFAETEPDARPIEVTPDNSIPELNIPLVEGIPDDSVIQRLEEEINELIQEKVHLEETIYGKTQTLAEKNEKLAELDVQRHTLTQTEPTTIPETLLEEISKFREEKTELEEQKYEYEQEIAERTQELARKEEELAGRQVQLEALTEAEPETLSDTPVEETWIGRWKQWGQTDREWDTPPIEELPDNSASDFGDESLNITDTQQLKAEIDELIHQRDDIEQELRQKNEDLARTQEDLAGLKAELASPTEIELNQPSAAISQVNIKRRFSWLFRIPSVIATFIATRIVAFISTLVLIFLAGYLFIFYASAIDKAFFLNEEEITKQIDEGTYSSGIRALVDPKALEKSYQNRNYLVLFGPILFLAFALVVDLLWKPERKWPSITFAVLTLALDFLLAIHISQKIHLAEAEIQTWAVENSNTEKWTLFGLDTIFEVLTVIFFGFVASLLASILHHVTREQWEQVRSRQPKSEEDMRYEIHREAEKTKREARIAVVSTKIDNLQNGINQLNEKVATTEQKISDRQTKAKDFLKQRRVSEIKVVKGTIETQIAVLNVEINNLRNEINTLTEKVADIQQNLEELSKHQRATEIRVARMPIDIQIAVLHVEIDNLRNEINTLTERVETAHKSIEYLLKQRKASEIKAAKVPIEAQIAVLSTEIDNLQSEIDTFKETSKDIQKEVNEQQSKIEELVRQRNERVVSLSKMQSQVNQFLNGWFRFIAHSVDRETDVSIQIESVKQIAENTLNQYYRDSPDYFSQS